MHVHVSCWWVLSMIYNPDTFDNQCDSWLLISVYYQNIVLLCKLNCIEMGFMWQKEGNHLIFLIGHHELQLSLMCEQKMRQDEWYLENGILNYISIWQGLSIYLGVMFMIGCVMIICLFNGHIWIKCYPYCWQLQFEFAVYPVIKADCFLYKIVWGFFQHNS